MLLGMWWWCIMIQKKQMNTIPIVFSSFSFYFLLRNFTNHNPMVFWNLVIWLRKIHVICQKEYQIINNPEVIRKRALNRRKKQRKDHNIIPWREERSWRSKQGNQCRISEVLLVSRFASHSRANLCMDIYPERPVAFSGSVFWQSQMANYKPQRRTLKQHLLLPKGTKTTQLRDLFTICYPHLLKA